ncbi:ABC multidrug transporter [Akanthomyces lecanii RCEF 1005]|uniref:ABC multidrug transporter n=1 Tax=Akanthomyces lecanii RCEF 1005 TaxID=1081108 RepID=A0A162KJJ4_CORDF|nr:ABC multidrug transporter [Akanthomyces lecanii RCEF 1005]
MATRAEDQPFWAPIMGIFDFTLKFEESILQILPSGLVIAMLPFAIFHYWNQPVYVRSSPLLWVKLIVLIALVVVEATSLSLRTMSTEARTDTSVPAASMELIAALTIGSIIYMEHRHAIRTSALLGISLLAGILIDIVKSRSFFLRHGLAALGALAVASGSLRLCLLILEEISRRALVVDKGIRQSLSAEATSGFMTRLLFLFLTPMLTAGFSQELGPKHLTKLGLDFSSQHMHEKLKKHWKRAKNHDSRPGLMLACWSAWQYQILQVLAVRLLASCFILAQPFVIQAIIEVVDLHAPKKIAQSPGLVCATILVFGGATLTKTAATHLANRLITQIRGALIGNLFEKNHSLSEEEAKKSAALTLMSTDIDAIASGLPQCIEIPVTVAETGLGIYFLSFFIGYSCVIILFPVLFTTTTSYVLGKWIGPAFASWNQSIETRVAKTSNILGQLPGIKMLGLGPTVSVFLHRLRVEEVKVSNRYRTLVSLSVLLVQFADLMSPIIVVAGGFFWHGFDHEVTASKVFPTLAIVGLVQGPLARILEAYPTAMSMVVCFARLQAFLHLKERSDSRIKWDPSAPPESYESVPTHFGSTIMRPRPPPPNPTGVVQFVDAMFGPRNMEDPLLQDVSFSLGQASVTSVVGRTGSGKSTLLGGVMGETRNSGGYIYVEDGAKIAYCGPDVWLRDVSIRDNILNFLPYDSARFTLAIECCQLEEDLSRLPGGDQYLVGANGANLSGGQRQRVGIARTVFAQAPVTVLDDVFSSLDRTTAVSVMYALCGENGVLRQSGSTVLLASHLPECLRVSDQVAIIDEEGYVTLDQGDFLNPDRELQISTLLDPAKACVAPEIEDKQQAVLRRTLEYEFSESDDAASEMKYARQKGDMRLYLLFIDPIGRLNAFFYSWLIFLLSSGEILPDIYMRLWIEMDSKSAIYFYGYVGIAAATCMIGSLAYFLLYTKFAARASISLHEQLLHTTMHSTLAFLSVTKVGNLVNRYSQDSLYFSKQLPAYMMRTLYVFYSAVIFTGIILSGATYMSLTLPMILIILFLVQRFYLRTSRQMRHLDLERKAPLYTFFQESADGLRYIQSSQSQQKNLELGHRLLDESQLPFYLMYCIQQWLNIVLGLTSTFVAFVLVMITLFTEDSTSKPAVGLAFLGILAFNRTIEFLLQSWTQLETSLGALLRLRQFKKETPQENKQALVTLPENWPSVGKVDITNVTARYRPTENVPPVLKDISLGKTSILLALLGFLDYSGTIEIDDVDLKSIQPDLLRSRLVTISQEQVRFDATIRVNLLPFDMNDALDVNDEKAREDVAEQDRSVEALLERLDIWRQIRHRGGLYALLTDVGYSQGELQLLCLARAILRQRETRSRVVLIDEATSNMDILRDDAARQVMDESFRDCTIFTIAHRRDTLRDADCTIELSRGKICHFDIPSGYTDKESSPHRSVSVPR